MERLACQAIQSLTENLQKARKKTATRRKFEFNSANLAIVNSSSESNTSASRGTLAEEESAPKPVSLQTDASKASSSGITISSVSDEFYILEPNILAATSASLTKINRSFVDLSGQTKQYQAISTLTVQNIDRSLLICGNIDGAAHITGVERSTLILNSRQVRLHDCKDCVLYLRCGSRPIIEDCKEIKFAPLPQYYVSKEMKSPR